MFKKTILSVMGVLFGMNAFAGTPLTNGTPVQITVTNAISSKNKPTTAEAFVAFDVVKDGVVLIKQGTPVTMSVESKKRKGCGRPGMLVLQPVSTMTTDGQMVSLNGGKMEVEGKNKKGKAIGLGVGLGVGLMCPPLLACLAIKGGQAEIPAGTHVNAIVYGNYDVK